MSKNMEADGTYRQLEAQCEGHRDALEWLYIHDHEEWDDIDPDERAGIDHDEVCEDGTDTVSLMDYVYNALDVEIHGHYDRDAMAWEADYVEVLFTVGGPDVRFTTERGGCVVGRWGSDEVNRSVSGDVGRSLDEILTEGL